VFVAVVSGRRRTSDFTGHVAMAVSNWHARTRSRWIADEQAALRRVASLVARAAPPAEVFGAVAEEVGHIVPAADFAGVGRDDPDGALELVGAWNRTGRRQLVGLRVPLGARNVNTLVFERNRPARVDHLTRDGSVATAGARELGVRSSAGAPISVDGRLWGVMIAASAHEDSLPVGVEDRVADFTELTANAIAEAHAELTASRARIVATADETRRRIERDLHDGAQQQLVSLIMQLRATRVAVPPELGELDAELDRMAARLTSTLNELRDYSRGIHPAVLAEAGLDPTLTTLARRSPVTVQLGVRTRERLPEQVEVAAYYVVSEALANAAKHARASVVTVAVEAAGGVLRVLVRDDGAGGAGFARGTGLLGLKERVEALSGRISLDSPRGAGTTLRAELPLTGASRVSRPGPRAGCGALRQVV
jgi:signal transduction histidine kinase